MSPPLSKRRKVTESCELCRTKKTRCDGLHPHCSPCVKKGVKCQYNEPSVPVSLRVLSDIDARLQRLEQGADAKAAHTPAQGTSPREYQELASNDSTREPETPSADHPTAQFIQDITQNGEFHLDGQRPRIAFWGQTNVWPTEIDRSMMVLPQRRFADMMLDCYEKYSYPLFPILHIPSFRKSYVSLWEDQGQTPFDSQGAKVTFWASLNIVFALGCINSPEIEPPLKLKMSKNFYQRAQAILPMDTLDVPSLAIVQYLLLTTHYLSFTTHFFRCFNTLAVAIRVAQTLGLGIDAEPFASNQLKREMSKRAWYHCLSMDRSVTPLPL